MVNLSSFSHFFFWRGIGANICSFSKHTKFFPSLIGYRIDSIPLSVFSEMHSLEAIKLSNNKIKHLPPQAFQSITETRAVIDVHGESLNVETKKLPSPQPSGESQNNNCNNENQCERTTCGLSTASPICLPQATERSHIDFLPFLPKVITVGSLISHSTLTLQTSWAPHN